MSGQTIIAGLNVYANTVAKAPYIHATSSILNNPEIFQLSPYGESLYIREVYGGTASNYNTDTGFTPGGTGSRVDWNPFNAQFDRKFVSRIDARKELQSISAQGMIASGAIALNQFWANFGGELDAVTYSSVFQEIDSSNVADTVEFPLDSANVFKSLSGLRSELFNRGIAETTPVVVLVRSSVFQNIENAILDKNGLANSEVLKAVPAADGLEIEVKVRVYHNLFLIRVPDERMVSNVILLDGSTAGQEAGGWTPDTLNPNFKEIELLVVPKTFGGQSVRHLVNNFLVPQNYEHLINSADFQDAVNLIHEYYQGSTVFQQIGVNQQADAWQFNNRIIYDTAVFKSQKSTLLAVVKPSV